MKTIAIAFATAAALWTTSGAHMFAVATPNPSIVAKVNEEAVTREEFQRMLGNPLTRKELEEELGAEPPRERLERLALRKLIHRRLLLQEASRRKITISDEELDTGLTALRRRFDDLKSFGQWMKAQNLDDRSLFQAVRGEMLTARVAGAIVADVRVTPTEVQEYYAAHRDELRIHEVWIQVITVSERATAESIQAALGKGEDFGRLAQQKSLGLRASRGGDVGWVNAETLWTPMREAISTLRPGQAIGPLQKGDEFLIVRLHDRRVGRFRTLDEARPEVERRVLAARQQAALKAWLTEQEKNAKIEVLM